MISANELKISTADWFENEDGSKSFNEVWTDSPRRSKPPISLVSSDIRTLTSKNKSKNQFLKITNVSHEIQILQIDSSPGFESFYAIIFQQSQRQRE